MAANQISIRCGMHSIRDKPNESETVEEQPTLSMAASKEQDLEKTIDDSQFEDMRQKNSKILVGPRSVPIISSPSTLILKDSQRNRILFFVESRFGLTSLGKGVGVEICKTYILRFRKYDLLPGDFHPVCSSAYLPVDKVVLGTPGPYCPHVKFICLYDFVHNNNNIAANSPFMEVSGVNMVSEFGGACNA